MDGYKDAHTHIHPSATATRGFMNALGFPGPWDGTIEQALPIMDKARIATTMIVPLIADAMLLAEQMEAELNRGGKPDRDRLIAQLAAEQSAYNSWAAGVSRESNGRFAALIAVNPVLFGAQWTRDEIQARLAEGATAIKILPTQTGVYPHDPKMSVVWEEANRRGLAVLTLSTAQVSAQSLAKMGMNQRYSDINHPCRFEEVVKAYPRVKLVLAHLGKGAEEDTIRLANKYPNVFTDASLRLHKSGPPQGWGIKEPAELFRRIGIDRVLFASNYPFVSQADYVEIMERLPLSDDERRQIGSENYDRVYGKS